MNFTIRSQKLGNNKTGKYRQRKPTKTDNEIVTKIYFFASKPQLFNVKTLVKFFNASNVCLEVSSIILV